MAHAHHSKQLHRLSPPQGRFQRQYPADCTGATLDVSCYGRPEALRLTVLAMPLSCYTTAQHKLGAGRTVAD